MHISEDRYEYLKYSSYLSHSEKIRLQFRRGQQIIQFVIADWFPSELLLDYYVS